MDAITKAVMDERERCAKIAEARCTADHAKYKDEKDWRQPYCFNRVIRASMDIAAQIRAIPPVQPE